MYWKHDMTEIVMHIVCTCVLIYTLNTRNAKKLLISSLHGDHAALLPMSWDSNESIIAFAYQVESDGCWRIMSVNDYDWIMQL